MFRKPLGGQPYRWLAATSFKLKQFGRKRCGDGAVFLTARLADLIRSDRDVLYKKIARVAVYLYCVIIQLVENTM